MPAPHLEAARARPDYPTAFRDRAAIVHPEPAATEAPPMVSSAALLQGGRRLRIAHEGEVYTLHLTRQRKLLLTK